MLTLPARILLVDDHELFREGLAGLIKAQPDLTVVGQAGDGLEALTMARDLRPDLIIMDINMPKMDGVSALTKIKQDFPTLTCVIISSERDEVTLGKAKKAGAFDFLVKPFTSEELVEVINRLSATLPERTIPQTGQLRDRRDVHLIQLASQYAKAHRTDDKALAVFEELAENPYCDEYWLKSLAMMYVIRMKWGKLKALAARLDEQT